MEEIIHTYFIYDGWKSRNQESKFYISLPFLLTFFRLNKIVKKTTSNKSICTFCTYLLLMCTYMQLHCPHFLGLSLLISNHKEGWFECLMGEAYGRGGGHYSGINDDKINPF